MTENSPKSRNTVDGSRRDSGTTSPSMGMTPGEKIDSGTTYADLPHPGPPPSILSRYPGGKNTGGSYQRLINQIPPHDVYIEAFLGSGAVMRWKAPAKINRGIEIDSIVIGKWYELDPPNIFLVNEDAVNWINRKIVPYLPAMDISKTFIFCDPPYIMETRSSPERIYKYEYAAGEHVKLLKLLNTLKAMVMITGYRHPIYDNALSSKNGWRRMDYQTMTHGGLKAESCWMNYPEPTELHDYRYLGDNWKKRQNIKAKQQRWIKRLKTMPELERRAMIEAINGIGNG